LSSRFRIRLAISLLAIASLALPARPQTSRGSVAGTVTDVSGAVVPDAALELTNKASGVKRATTTNAVGIYRFDAVDLGLFDLKINKAGFNVFLELGISVEGNRTTTVDVKLQVGGNETVVKVNAGTDELLLKILRYAVETSSPGRSVGCR